MHVYIHVTVKPSCQRQKAFIAITALDWWTRLLDSRFFFLLYLGDWLFIFNVEYTGRDVSTLHYLHVHFSMIIRHQLPTKEIATSINAFKWKYILMYFIAFMVWSTKTHKWLSCFLWRNHMFSYNNHAFYTIVNKKQVTKI